ncbi:hypothetical protein NPIL_107351 [Nephila pilipes]|uniref:Uncharacterized protein n=1 Tax=Nephila pilipes TaxID=299642 RepID=A0A8X6P0E8_NEPPI|nr:hypothetical protein NPIL_107351 [Nephila pilipes]
MLSLQSSLSIIVLDSDPKCPPTSVNDSWPPGHNPSLCARGVDQSSLTVCLSGCVVKRQEGRNFVLFVLKLRQDNPLGWNGLYVLVRELPVVFVCFGKLIIVM